jgi:hypothetical protein
LEIHCGISLKASSRETGTALVSVFDPTVNSGESFGVHRYLFSRRNVPLWVNHGLNVAPIFPPEAMVRGATIFIASSLVRGTCPQ